MPAHSVPVEPVVTPSVITPVAEKPVTVAPSKPAKVYKVKSGDTYWGIAQAHNMNYKVLQKLNGNKKLVAGSTLKLG
jgi:LysM repeat protein